MRLLAVLAAVAAGLDAAGVLNSLDQVAHGVLAFLMALLSGRR